MERHACPVCGTACPPRPPLHGPPLREILAAVRAYLAETHAEWCAMRGYPGGYQGYSGRGRSAHCGCPMREVYRLLRCLTEPPYEDLDT